MNSSPTPAGGKKKNSEEKGEETWFGEEILCPDNKHPFSRMQESKVMARNAQKIYHRTDSYLVAKMYLEHMFWK